MNDSPKPDGPVSGGSPEGPAEDESAAISTQSPKPRWAVFEVLWVALRLGLTSFGGPIAHLGYFREEYVVQRRWLDETSYADVVALCQFLPGPASSQVGIAVGYIRAGMAGGLAAWIGFTLPSALALVLFAYGVEEFDVIDAGWLHGLKLAAVAVVAQAVWGMGRSLAPDRERATIVIVAAVAALAWQSAIMQILIILVSGFAGWKLLKVDTVPASKDSLSTFIPKWMGIVALVLFFAILAGLPFARQFESNQTLAIFDSFFRSGSLVFGGGHVVLPLLQSEVVGPGWMTNAEFVAGYGATQAVPGPLFTFSAYMGAVISPGPGGIVGGGLALIAIFLPSFLLITGVLPFWGLLRRKEVFRSALNGVNAAVVGLLLAALYNPVWTSAVETPEDFALTVSALGLLMFWKTPPWMVVALVAGGGAAIAYI
jgi:chromate transporter